MNLLATILIASLGLVCLCALGVGERCWRQPCKGVDKCCKGYICGQNCTAFACTRQSDCSGLDGEICCDREYCAKPEDCNCTYNSQCGRGSCCGKTCSGTYSCVGLPCVSVSDCRDSGEVCCGGYCIRSSDECPCSNNSQCGKSGTCCSNRCHYNRKNCVGYKCSNSSDCQPDETCCDGYCKKGPDCTCSHGQCGEGRSCCSRKCRKGEWSCKGYSCSSRSDCMSSQFEHCCYGICKSSCKGHVIAFSTSRTVAIVMSFLVVVVITVTCLVVGLRYSIGPCRRRRQPESISPMAATSDMAEVGGPATPPPTAHPPGQEPPPVYTPVAGEQPEHITDACA